MTATNNVISIGLSLSILCMGIVCASESDFQSSIAELRALVIGQQDTITEMKNEVARQLQTILKQEETIHQLEQKLYKQEQRLDKLSAQSQFESGQVQVNNYITIFSALMLSDNISDNTV